MKKINKILIIRIDRIGDLICSTPFIKVVRENFPESHISILVNFYTKEVVEGNPALNEILIFDSFINSSKKIKMGKFDIVIVLSPIFKAYLLAYLSGAKIRTGIIYSQRLFNQIFAKFFLTHPLILYIEETLKRKENIPHEVEQILSIAKYFNWKINTQELFLPLGENDFKFAEKILLEKRIKLPIIGLHLSNKWFYEDFKIIDFKNLINKIQNKFKLPLVITYGEAERELAKNLEGDLNLKEVFIIGGLFLKSWASLIKKCALFFTMDTGATHVASAVGIPVVCVYQDENYEKCRSQWHPWGVPHLNLKRSELLNINEKLWEKIKQLIKV